MQRNVGRARGLLVVVAGIPAYLWPQTGKPATTTFTHLIIATEFSTHPVTGITRDKFREDAYTAGASRW